MRSFKSRELAGLLIGSTTLLVSLSPYPLFYLAILCLSLLVGIEVSRAVGLKTFYVAPLTFFFASLAPELGFISLLLLSLYVGWRSWSMEDFLKALLVSLYGGFLFLFLLQLKSMGDYALLKLLLFVWAVDVFSYYSGKKFGRRWMAPRLSPKKTWEGLLGGVLAGSLALLLLHGQKGLLWSPLLVSGAVFGDLFKSFIKRQVGIKDFSGVLGEHGGFTDRFDSLLFTAPLYLFLLKF
ncbi:MAG: phosphatidate cytidylyltransferase [Aquificaceae bacterium]|nr:phosphatidate cytidylyltransferase [Aquificaceae bacterium]MCX7989946.1 phosphatidate cytidylyltransferase [Aquificaceae bacterium]MDW8032518.1 phosphatidate cytidylyltransferase [Aquificaceae bacterium]MDW8293797.1 phosphatidate cytidylyltransferase [Aquificaceae bacterium]